MGAVVGCGLLGTRAGDRAPEGRKSTDSRSAAGYASADRLPERVAPDGTTIVVGNAAARSTVHVYEDPRSPVVEEYERTGAEGLEELLLAGEVKAQYTFASFKDDGLGGDGSKRAVNAPRAALEKDRFVEFHSVLFDDQTAVENSGGFTTERLLALAGKVPGLRDAAFDQAVRTMKYSGFVTAAQLAYRRTGDDPIGPGTPTVVINDHAIDGGLYPINFDEEALPLLVTDLHEHPSSSWDLVYAPLKKRLEASATPQSADS